MAGPDPTYDTLNYRLIGGGVWYINGELRIGPNGSITQDGVQAAAITPLTAPTPVVTTAPTLTAYGFTLAQAEAILTNLNDSSGYATQINAIIAALIGAGILAA